MTDTIDARDLRGRLRRIETLLGEIERFTDPSARAHTRELVEAILSLHGDGLERDVQPDARGGRTGGGDP